jgi:hypothetical protein
MKRRVRNNCVSPESGFGKTRLGWIVPNALAFSVKIIFNIVLQEINDKNKKPDYINI